MTWNARLSETEIVKLVCGTLSSMLPADWKLVEREEARTSRARADVIVELRAPDGSKATILIEAKRKLEPRDIPKVLEQLKRNGEGTPLVVSDFLTPRAREILSESGVGYADATGNFRLALSRPAFLIETKGADRDPRPDERPLKSLKGHAAKEALHKQEKLRHKE